MIELIDVAKRYRTSQGSTTVFERLNLMIRPGEKVGILGRNGAGKSTLIRLIGGSEMPDAGRVRRGMSVSWPLAFSGGFQGSLSGLDNLKFICRVYGTDYRDKLDQVQDFAELGKYLREPLKTYSAGMRARLAFALSMAIEFDCYLIDEVVAVGDARFTERCQHELFEKRKDRAMVFVSHHEGYMAAHCDSGHVLHQGRLHGFATVQEAQHFYQKTQHA